MHPGIIDRVLQRKAVTGGAEGHQNDGGAVVGRPHDALNDVAVLAEAVRIQNLHGHDLHMVVPDSGDSLQVVGAGGDDARKPGAVAVFIRCSVRGIEHGPAGHDNAGQIGMCGIHTGI